MKRAAGDISRGPLAFYDSEDGFPENPFGALFAATATLCEIFRASVNKIGKYLDIRPYVSTFAKDLAERPLHIMKWDLR